MKKPLKFPCAIAMSEIDSQEVYDKVFNAFIEAGAKDCENYNDPDNLGMGYCYFGVDSDQETIHWNNLEDYDADDCSNGYVAIYSLGDILGTTDQQEALSEPLGDVLEPSPSVGIDEVVELTTEVLKEYVEWGDWEVGDEVVFCGFSNPHHTHWSFTKGKIYIVESGKNGVAPCNDHGEMPETNWGFNFKKVVGVATTEAPVTYLGEDASVKIEFTICVGGVEHKVSRDEAFKVYEDLQSIFEKGVV
jgi:hypothetical protein